MAIYHLERSYLNWRAILRKENYSYLCNFFIIFFQPLFLFLFGLSRIFQVHDMTINFSFAFFLFIFFWMVYSGQCHMLWMAFQLEAYLLIWGSFWKGSLFGPKLFRSFLSKERIMAQKYFREMGNFGQRVSRHQSRWFQNIAILGFCLV